MFQKVFHITSVKSAKTYLSGFIIILILSSLGGTALAQQSKSQLEKEKLENLKRIKEAERILQQTATEKKSTLGQLNALNQQILAREGLAGSIRSEINLLDDQISEIGSIVASMEQDLSNLKKEYASMVYAASKIDRSYDKLIFIFSSSTFRQFIMRMKYLEQYSEVRKNQVEQIQKVTDALVGQRQSAQNKKVEKSALLEQQITENNNLMALRKEQTKLISRLSKEEAALQKELQNTKQAVARLDKLIADLVKAEIARAKAEEAKGNVARTPEASRLSANFSENKKKLFWPVESGFISGKFGTHPHPILKGVMTDNPGIEIQTNQSEVIRAVFDGEVKMVASVPGMANAVIIQHGEYMTVYAKIKNVTVKRNQMVKAKDVIGEVYTDNDGISEVHFELWKNNVKLDPQAWLNTR